MYDDGRIRVLEPLPQLAILEAGKHIRAGDRRKSEQSRKSQAADV